MANNLYKRVSSTNMKQRFRYIMGKNCLNEALDAHPEQFIEVYTCHKLDNDPLIQRFQDHGIKIVSIPRNKLNHLVDSESHQSFVAKLHEKAFIHIRDFLENVEDKKSSLVLMLDSIFDPQNLGAILRTAECFGVDLVIYSKNRGTELTPVATKTSAGASELVPISQVSNLQDTVKTFQKAGFWVATTHLGENSQSLYNFEFPNKTLLIMGSEGKGVQKVLVKNADFLLSIPMLGKIDSLNVGSATAVILSHYHSQHLPNNQ